MQRSIVTLAIASFFSITAISAAQVSEQPQPASAVGPPSLKCCQCVNGQTVTPPALDVSTGVVPWKVDGGPAHVTSASSPWSTLPPAKWVQKPAAGSPKPAGPGPFNYTTTFNVPSCATKFATVVVSGKFAADNGADLQLD